MRRRNLSEWIAARVTDEATRGLDNWRTSTGTLMRMDGTGLIAGGGLVAGFGATTLVTFGLLGTRESLSLPYNMGGVFGVSAAATVAGVGFLSWGIVRNGRYRAWRDATFAGTVPLLVPLRRGVGLGVALG